MKRTLKLAALATLAIVALALVFGRVARAGAGGGGGWPWIVGSQAASSYGPPQGALVPTFPNPVNSQYLENFSATGLFETVSSASYVTVMTLPTPTASTIYARCHLTARATVAPSGGSIGDFCNTTMDFAGVNIGGTASIVGGPTIIGTPYRASSLSTCNLATSNSGASLIVEATTAATGTIDGTVTCDWTVN